MTLIKRYQNWRFGCYFADIGGYVMREKRRRIFSDKLITAATTVLCFIALVLYCLIMFGYATDSLPVTP